MSFYVCVCVLDNSAVAEPLTVRPLVELNFILVNETPSVCRDAQWLYVKEMFLKGFSEGAGREYTVRRNRLEFSFFFHSIKYLFILDKPRK